MKTREVKIAYATLKDVLEFFGTDANYVKFPTEDDIDYDNDDDCLFLSEAMALPDIPKNTRGEHVSKPTFKFGRVVMKMTDKAATNYAVADCDILISTYLYDNEAKKSVDGDANDPKIKKLIAKGRVEERVQISIVSPSDGKTEKTVKSKKDFAALRVRPASAASVDDDDDDDNE